MLNTSDEELRSDLLRRLVAQSLLGFLDHLIGWHIFCPEIIFSAKIKLWWKLWHSMHLFSKDTLTKALSNRFRIISTPASFRWENCRMVTWQTYSFYSQHGVGQKQKIHRGTAHSTRCTKNGLNAWGFTKKAHTQCAKHVLKSDQRFMLQPMLALTRYILFLFNPCNLVLFNVFLTLQLWIHLRTLRRMLPFATNFCNTTHNSFAIAKFTGCHESTAAPTKGWSLWS